MSLIRRHESCVGLLLWKSGQNTVELWVCPPDYAIKEHSHPDENIELMYLFGKTTFYRRSGFLGFEQSFTPRFWNFANRFSVPAGWSHRFRVGKWPLVFLNFAKWRVGVTPTSASVDFQLTK